MNTKNTIQKNTKNNFCILLVFIRKFKLTLKCGYNGNG